ncbi:DUF2790 domain-containing protein [Pseudomonas sp. SDO528_S397]
MNWNTFIAAGLFSALNLVALTAHADTRPPLDVRHVLSITEDSSVTCGVVNAQMIYLDSHGEQRVLNYGTFSDSCGEGS